LGHALEDGIRETLNLSLVSMGVFAERAVKLAVFGRETFHLAGFVEPGKKNVAFDAAVFPIDPKPFFEIASSGNQEVQVPERAAGKIHFHKPAVSAKFFA